MVESFHSKQALTPAQAQAIQHVSASASSVRQPARERIERHLTRAGFLFSMLRDILAAVRRIGPGHGQLPPRPVVCRRLACRGGAAAGRSVPQPVRDGRDERQPDGLLRRGPLGAEALRRRLSSGRSCTPGAPEIRGAESDAAPARGRAGSHGTSPPCRGSWMRTRSGKPPVRLPVIPSSGRTGGRPGRPGSFSSSSGMFSRVSAILIAAMGGIA